MRILRVSVRDFRGVAAADITMAPDGVTIVQGPNEVGKSTIADAIDMLIADPDSSTKARVKAAQPVGRDVGPWVEMEFETGPYHLVYSKRWVRGAGTELRVSGPRDEQHTGRAAHDRVGEILDETLDAALFAALRHQQGMPLDQADLGPSATLARALDLAAGAGGVAADDALIDRIDQERLTWSTAGGAPNKARLDLRAAAEHAEASAVEQEQRLVALEARVEEHRRLTRDLEANAQAEPGMRERAASLAAQLAEVEAREAAVREVAQAAEVADAHAHAAAQEVQARDALVRAAADAVDRVAGVHAEAAALAQRVEPADAAVAGAAARLSDAAGELREAEDALGRATAAAEQVRDAFDLELLLERRGQVERAEQRIAACEGFLADCAITADLMQAIEDAATADAMARGRLQASGVRIAITAEADIDVVAAEGPVHLSAGETADMSLAPGDDLVLPGVAAVRLHEAHADDLHAADAAAAQLASALERAGVADGGVTAARALERARQERERELGAAREERARALRDLTSDEMDQKIARARARIEAHHATAPAVSLDEANALRVAREADRDAARRAEAVARVVHAEADAAARALRAEAAECAGRLHAEEQRRADEHAALAGARETCDDSHLAARAADARALADAARERHAEQAAALAGDDPGSVRLRAHNANEALDRLLAERAEMAIRAATLEGEIGQAGEDGLADRAARAREHAGHAAQERDRAERQAEAADLLHAVMTRHLDAARRAYVAPFRDEVERLARLVFGPGTSVEVDHATLRVVSRTREGVTVPYEALSGGAREQLAVIGRLAAASLVSADGGAPVIIDDALGYSDPSRLEGLGAALASAGSGAQVIVLTCMPDRYAAVGSASVVRMEPGAAGSQEPGAPPAPGAEVA